MIYWLLIVTAGVALAVLYKFAPTRKSFMAFCTLLLVVFSVSAFIHGKQVQREQITRAQLEELQARQKIFGEWYAAYQKDIDRLDRNWQLYHNILDDLQTEDAESFNAEALYQRLKALEQDSLEEQMKIHEFTPPHDLGRKNRKLVEEVIRKTQQYVDAQTQAIRMSVVEATPPVELETLRRRLHDIMIRKSPEGLFIAQEISSIRAALDDLNRD